MNLLVHVLLDMKVVMSMVIGLTIVGLKPFSEEPLRKTIKIVFVTEQVTTVGNTILTSHLLSPGVDLVSSK